MIGHTKRKRILAVGVGGALCLIGRPDAQAQTALPEIVVTAPSPIARPAPAREPAPEEPSPALAEAPAPSEPDVYPIVGDTFSPVTVVPSQQILRTPGATFGDTLFTTPGVTGNTFAPGASRPVIRGLDNARVRIQENGIGAMDVSTLSEDHAVPVDPLTTDRLEVIRGPATLRWGPSAIGGVVAASNNRIPDPMTPAGVHVTAKGALSSVDNGREGAVIVDGRTPNFAVHADYFHRKAGDYRIPGGVQANTSLETKGMAVGASYFFKEGYLGFAVSHIKSLYHIPGIEAAESNSRIDLDQTKIMSRGEFRVDSTFLDTVRFWMGATSYKHKELGLLHEHEHEHEEENGHEEPPQDGVHATFKNREYEGRVEVQHLPVMTAFGALTGAAGVQFGHRNLRAEGEGSSLLAPSLTDNAAAYLFEELRLTDTVRLQAAGRAGAVKVRGTAAQFPPDLLPEGGEPAESARQRDFVPVSAGLGLLKDLPWGMVASLNGQYAERAPDVLELFAKGQHHASGTFEIGNPDLRKEAAYSVEASLRRPKGDLRFEATAFHARYSGFIYKRLTGNTCGEDFDSCIAGEGEELKQVAVDQKDATFTGAEIAGQLDLIPIGRGTFGVDAQYDIVRARFTDGTNVPRIPPQRLGGGLYWRNANWFARVKLLHAFAQNDIAAEETPTPGYNLLNATLSYTHRFKPGDLMREVTVGVLGANLLDEDMRNSASFKKDEVLLPGRNVRVFATLRW